MGSPGTLPVIYQGSVKDLLGPAKAKGQPALVFEYTDAYSVFDWGRMPDPLPRKGEALAVLAAHFFEKLEKPESWVEFLSTPAAAAMKKSGRFGQAFETLGSELSSRGLRTHYQGVLRSWNGSGNGANDLAVESLGAGWTCPRHLVVRQVSVVRPERVTVLGRALPDYLATRLSPLPRLVPLEVVFRFSCPEGSSLLERVARDPDYLESIGFGGLKVSAGARWDFPVLEVFTKLESADRHLPLSEALAIAGIPGQQVQKLLLKTAWVAGFLRDACSRVGLELADGKLEWAVDSNGECFLVDAIGPDELRILSNKGTVQLSKEFLRIHYRGTPWYKEIGKAKAQAQSQGGDWKRLVATGPAELPKGVRDLAAELYPALANTLTGHTWFADALPLEKVAEGIADLSRKKGSGS